MPGLNPCRPQTAAKIVEGSVPRPGLEGSYSRRHFDRTAELLQTFAQWMTPRSYTLAACCTKRCAMISN